MQEEQNNYLILYYNIIIYSKFEQRYHIGGWSQRVTTTEVTNYILSVRHYCKI